MSELEDLKAMYRILSEQGSNLKCNIHCHTDIIWCTFPCIITEDQIPKDEFECPIAAYRRKLQFLKDKIDRMASEEVMRAALNSVKIIIPHPENINRAEILLDEFVQRNHK